MATSASNFLADPWPIFRNTLSKALVDDVLSLASLHNEELKQDVIKELKEVFFPFNLGMQPQGDQARIWSSMQDAVYALNQSMPLDELAAEYAAIYLTGAYQASPYESVWTDDDHLMCQGSMFELRRIYRDAGFRVKNWRSRPDDHLVYELSYLAHCIENISDSESARATLNFLDQHLLLWYPKFVQVVSRRSSNDFYVALNLLTCSWCSTIRNSLADSLGLDQVEFF